MTTKQTLSAFQLTILEFLNAIPWAGHRWHSIYAHTKRTGKVTNPVVTIRGLINRGLIEETEQGYKITAAGVEQTTLAR